MKIAVIDDERPARKMLIRRVKEVLPDCDITEAESGADALRMFNEADSFDLIFVDMDLGDMEGTTLAATAKRLFPRAKIVFATAYSQYAAKAYEMEIDDYILKPFDPERVHHVVKKCIGEGKRDPAGKMEEQDGEENTGIQVYIGNESSMEPLRDCSVVTTTYDMGNGMRGTIGIVGPKRMDYENVVDNLKTLKVQLDAVFKKPDTGE